ncbi:MAG: YdiU family protein, partial [Methylotenera sp.]|nr:YdiU family protein [Flavobacterium sp.]
LGLRKFEASLFKELVMLMMQTHVDYTIFFRELSSIPEDITPLLKSFYKESPYDEQILKSWSQWLDKWKLLIHNSNSEDKNATTSESRENLSEHMKRVNPKYILREWFLVPAYQQAASGDYALIGELQEVMTNPYADLSYEMEEKYYKKKPSHFFEVAGMSHVSCSS